MPRFRRKPLTVEAVQFTGDNIGELNAFTGLDLKLGKGPLFSPRYVYIVIPTLEDGLYGQVEHVAEVNDWIIKGVDGEFYPCKPDIFKKTYEPVGN